MSGQIHELSHRPSAEQIHLLTQVGSSVVCEAMGRKNHISYRPIFKGPCVVGPAITVGVPRGDHLMVHVAFDHLRQGDFLVVVPNEDDTHAYFGDLMATSAKARGCAGLLVDGGVRDIAELEAMAFPVWARAICPAGTDRKQLGSVNVPVICAGVTINAGDLVVADQDGVAIIPFNDVEAVVKKAQDRINWEADVKARLAQGEPSISVLALTELLETLDQ